VRILNDNTIYLSKKDYRDLYYCLVLFFDYYLKYMSKKTLWYAAEQLVKQEYITRWWKFLHENRTIRGGEIDLILQSSSEVVFVEVKCVDHTDDLHNYITRSKLRTLHRSIATYHHRIGVPKSHIMRVDVVFVKDNAILHIFDHCSMPA
jgi:Holliday junction resolvase-like predicted endonuclease